MKKLTTKLLMAIIAVAFAFVALGTSTYAWFSMNQEVSASGITITAKADETFLLISKNAAAQGATTAEHAAAIQTENATSVDLQMSATANPATDAKLLPVHYGAEAYTTTALDTKTNWKVAYSTDPEEVQEDADQTALTNEANLANYVFVQDFYVTVAKDAVPAKDLKVSEVTIPENKGIRVVIATSVAGSGVIANSTLGTQPSLTNANITDSTVINVRVYVFFEGTDTNVYQTNLANLTGSISFKLHADTVNE